MLQFLTCNVLKLERRVDSGYVGEVPRHAFDFITASLNESFFSASLWVITVEMLLGGQGFRQIDRPQCLDRRQRLYSAALHFMNQGIDAACRLT
ncbi:MAG: hypothetical protein U0231_15860 [Nitrospiraceae bacterium]